jgi:hypothetical protein
MKFRKSQITAAELPYAVSVLPILGKERVVCASEGPGPAVVFDGEELRPRVLADGIGGSMGSAPYPGCDDRLFMVTGFLPVFDAEKSGIDLCRAVDGLEAPWDSRRVIDLPFVHRIATVTVGDQAVIIAATVCGGKQDRDDWSQPGAVYAIRVPDSQEGPWQLETVIEGLHRNHGLTVCTVDGVATVLITADEGVFALPVPANHEDKWQARLFLERPVSEIAMIDWDEDGRDEFVTVEPFHGTSLCLYRRAGSGWERLDSSPLDFGHGLSAGRIAGRPVAVIGNRAGSFDLLCFSGGAGTGELKRFVVEAGAGTAGTAVIDNGDGGLIVASNAALGEYAVYSVEEGV